MSSRILAIDPGNEMSAWVHYEDGRVWSHGYADNGDLLHAMYGAPEFSESEFVIEMVASYGMAVGREVFETVYWIGRFAQAWELNRPTKAHRLYRRDVKMHLCGNNTAKDSNIRQALIDKFGPGKDKAIGKKATPGPLYGIAGDEWAALAVAVTFAETKLTQAA